MNIGNLIASNIISNSGNTEISQIMLKNPAFMQAIDDRQYATALVQNNLFLVGAPGDFEAYLVELLNGIIKQCSKAPNVYSGYLPDTRQVFTNMPNAADFNKVFVEQAKQRMSVLYNWDVKDDKFNALASANSCAVQTFEFLNRAVGMYFVKIKKGDTVERTRTLVTRNLELINVLDKLHMIKWDEKTTINDFFKKLWDKDQATPFFKEGKAWVVHLRCSRVIYGADGSRLPLFEVTTSRGRIAMATENTTDKKTGVEKTTGIIPLSAVYAEELVLKQILSTGVFRVVKMSNDGPHERLITSNPDIVKSVYSSVPMEELQEKLNMLYDASCSGNKPLNSKASTGFSILGDAMHHYFVDLESSIHSSMIWGIQPGAWETITAVPVNTVSTRCHNVDFYLLNQILASKVLNARKADFELLPADLKLSEYQFANDKREAVFAYTNELENNELFDFMSANQNFFGDLTTQLATRAKYRRHFLKNFQPINLEAYQGKDPDVIVAELKKYLSAGVVKLTVASQKYGRYEVMGTTNTSILASTYGKNYQLKFGSPREKLNTLKNILNQNADTTVTAEMIGDYGLADKLPENFSNMPRAQQISSIDEAILQLQQRDTTIVPGTLSFKVADGYKVVDKNNKISIYRQFNVANIVAASFSPVKEN